MTTSGISVRTAQPGDAAGIAELGARTFLAAFGAANKPKDIEAYVEESFRSETVERQIVDPHSAFLLVVRGNPNIGYTKLRRGKVPDCVNGPNPIELERIYGDASHQGAASVQRSYRQPSIMLKTRATEPFGWVPGRATQVRGNFTRDRALSC